MKKQFINQKVIVRANEAGVFFGTLVKIKKNTVLLKDVRKLYYWDGACAVEQISVDGVKNPENCKFTIKVESLFLKNPIQILICTEKAIYSIEQVKEWKI